MPWGHSYVPLHDGRWTRIDGINVPVRTGPRGKRWQFFQQFADSDAFVLTQGVIAEFALQHGFHVTEFSSNQIMNNDQLSSTAPSYSASLYDNSSLFLPEELAFQSRSSSPTSTLAIEPDKSNLGSCTCPISYTCQRRAAGKLDCRPLVPEWQEWGERMDRDVYISLLKASGNPQRHLATQSELKAINEYLDKIDNRPLSSTGPRKFFFGKVRDWILKMTESDVTKQDLNTTKVVDRLEKFLDPSNALNRQAKMVIPWLEESLTIIMRKWRRGDLSCDHNRGLTAKETYNSDGTKLRQEYLLDKTWAHYRSANYFGEGELVNGQIWRTRVQMMRDGAHAPRIAGISGNICEGAYSVVMGLHDVAKNRFYADIDRGEVVDYLGTALFDDEDPNDPKPTNTEDLKMPNKTFQLSKEPTGCTKILMTSLVKKAPVRLFRSFRLAEVVSNKPELGYRYDGLYQVIGQTLLKKDRQIWSFKMKRLPGQAPLHGFKVGEPTTRASRGKRPGHAGVQKKRQR